MSQPRTGVAAISTTDIFKVIVEPINNHGLFQQLFTHIKKNTAIPDFLASIETDQQKKQKTNELYLAIKAGDHAASIFDDPDCYLYLLYLIKDNQIPFWHGMTVYFYLMTLMQFTPRQKLKAEDIRDINVGFLSNDGVLTANGEKLLKSICERLSGGMSLYPELKAFVLTLPPSEQWVVKIPSKSNDFDFLIDGITDYICSSPFLLTERMEHDPSLRATLVPSFSIIQFCLRKTSPTPVEMQVGFGSVSSKTLNTMHQENKHPLPIYAPAVKSNMTKAHDRNCGCVGAFLHDLVHVYFGSLLSPSFREKIYDLYIPCLEKLKKSEADLIEPIDAIIWHLGDFDLLDILSHITVTSKSSEEEREKDYFTKCFITPAKVGINNHLVNFSGLYDKLYSSIEVMRQSDCPKEEKEFWDKASTAVKLLVSRGEERMLGYGKRKNVSW